MDDESDDRRPPALPPDLWGGPMPAVEDDVPPADGGGKGSPHDAAAPPRTLRPPDGLPVTVRRGDAVGGRDGATRSATAPGRLGAEEESGVALTAWRRLLRARALVGEEIERRLAQSGLPPLAWHELLGALDEAPRRRMRHGALAERVMLSRGGLTRLVDRLAGAGLVERLPCEGDRRGATISLTAAGAETLIRTRAVHSAVLERHFSGPLGVYAAGVSDALAAVIARAEADAPNSR